MAIMNQRTTLTLDEATIQRIKTLASLWKVSKAEVVRRAVEQAERETTEQKTAPLESLKAYHQRGGLGSEKAESYLREVRENRGAWRGKE